MIQTVSALQENTWWLNNALDRLEALSRSSERQQAIQHYFDKAVENLQNIISSVVDANSRMVGIGNVVHKCKTARADVSTAHNAATAAFDAYNKLVDEYQICPLCGTGKLTKMEMT